MLHYTPAMLEAAYELLRTTPPFSRWKLPEPDEVEFRVTRRLDYNAQIQLRKDKPPIIEISSRAMSTLPPLIRAMAHEMTHLHEHLCGDMRSDCKHGAGYRRRARQVCSHHCFDPMQFGGLE